MARLRVLLLFGGRSAEHDVSRTSAVGVGRALDPSRYDVIPVAITKTGQWLLAGAAQHALAGPVEEQPIAFAVDGEPIVPVSVAGQRELVAQGGGVLPGPVGFDVVIPLLHGPFGEDGTMQGLLELADVPYVGTGVLGAAVAMDKVMTKRALASAGLPSARWLAFRDGGDREALAARVAEELGFPCFVKPANLGSSVGVTKVRDRQALPDAVDEAVAFDEWILVEEGIDGREIEVGILGDDPPQASVPGEIVPGAETYTYADKYEDGAARLLIPAPLPPAAIDEVQQLAVRAFEACRVEAMARVDFFYEERARDGGPGRGWLVNELNTIPGFTPISMYPRLWAESGVSYSELLDRLITLAIQRHERRTLRAGRQHDAR